MNREIKFRGKRKDTDEWIYGSLVNNLWVNRFTKVWSHYIIDSDALGDYDDWISVAEMMEDFEVKPETVGQFTGLKDKNDKEIYEGDIVNTPVIGQLVLTTVVFGDMFGNPAFVFRMCNGSSEYEFDSAGKNVEIVGDIYENSELLTGDDK